MIFVFFCPVAFASGLFVSRETIFSALIMFPVKQIFAAFNVSRETSGEIQKLPKPMGEFNDFFTF